MFSQMTKSRGAFFSLFAAPTLQMDYILILTSLKRVLYGINFVSHGVE